MSNDINFSDECVFCSREFSSLRSSEILYWPGCETLHKTCWECGIQWFNENRFKMCPICKVPIFRDKNFSEDTFLEQDAEINRLSSELIDLRERYRKETSTLKRKIEELEFKLRPQTEPSRQQPQREARPASFIFDDVGFQGVAPSIIIDRTGDLERPMNRVRNVERIYERKDVNLAGNRTKRRKWLVKLIGDPNKYWLWASDLDCRALIRRFNEEENRRRRIRIQRYMDRQQAAERRRL